MNQLVINVIADGKQLTEVTEITSTLQDMALGRMNFRVQPGSELHDLMAKDGAPILCSWDVGVARRWYEIQCNTDTTFYVKFF